MSKLVSYFELRLFVLTTYHFSRVLELWSVSAQIPYYEGAHACEENSRNIQTGLSMQCEAISPSILGFVTYIVF